MVAPYSGAMLAMVARSGRDSAAMPGPKNSTNFPTTPFLRSICVTVSTRSVAVAPAGKRPVSRNPTTWGMSMVMRLSEERGLRFDATHAPAHHAERVHHGGVRVGAHQRVRVEGLAIRGNTTWARYSQVHLVADAGVRRHDAEVVEGLLAPAEEGVPLAVAVELELGVGCEGGTAPELVDHHRVVDDQVRRVARVDLLRVAAERRQRLAHRRQVDHRGDAGEVLQQHTRHVEGDFGLRSALASQAAIFSTCSRRTTRPSSWRSRFSRSTFREKGSRATAGWLFASSDSRNTGGASLGLPGCLLCGRSRWTWAVPSCASVAVCPAPAPGATRAFRITRMRPAGGRAYLEGTEGLSEGGREAGRGFTVP